jgi:hypothetical protein
MIRTRGKRVVSRRACLNTPLSGWIATPMTGENKAITRTTGPNWSAGPLSSSVGSRLIPLGRLILLMTCERRESRHDSPRSGPDGRENYS